MVNIVNDARNKHPWLMLGRADYSVVVVFSAQLIRSTSLDIFNLLVSYTELFRGNFID